MGMSVLRTPVLWRGEGELLGLADVGPRDDHVRAELLAPLHLPPSPFLSNRYTEKASRWISKESERHGVARKSGDRKWIQLIGLVINGMWID
jgi:hypothetical protein